MAKIGICGAQSVGKTTLLNALRNEKYLIGYDFCDEVTRWVGSLGLAINEQGNDNTQMLIAMRHIYNLRMHRSFITDRTILDCYVYSKWLFRNNQISYACLDEIGRIFKEIKLDYTHLFYIKPEFKIENDGVRSTDEVFQKQIVELFEDTLFEHYYDDEYTILTGTVEDRVTQFREAFKREVYGR